MNSPKKNNPISREELLDLLEKKSGNSGLSSFSNAEVENLDEFEKEALEGFAEFGSATNAKKLIEEINQDISNKIKGEGPATKNRIIWFSAAASLVLVITLSIFLINKTQKETESNIALNDITKKEADLEAPALEQETKPIETLSGELKEGANELQPAKTLEGNKQMPLEKLAEEKMEAATKMEDAIVATGSSNANGISLSSVSINQPDANKNKDKDNFAVKGDMDVVSNMDTKASMPVMQIAETKKKAQEEDKQVSDEVAVTESSAAKAELAMNEKANYESKFKERKVAKKAAVTKTPEASSGYFQNTATTTVPSIAENNVTNIVAHYEGNEAAIKKYVLDYLKKQSISQQMKGSFKINGTVNEKGKLIVDSVSSINNECKDCELVLKNGLNAMPDWQPAEQSGKAVSSRTSFVLNF